MSNQPEEFAVTATTDPEGNDSVAGVVRLVRAGEDRRIELQLQDGISFAVHSSTDFEEAVVALRSELEAAGVGLLCNRFRRDAFVSSMARQMTDGLGCYLVRPGETVDPEQIVHSFNPAPSSETSTSAENAAFIAEWINSFS